jgi:hemerythrin
MNIRWTEDLTTGIMDIDEQHRELFRRIDALDDACRRQEGLEELGRYMAFLMEYVTCHFTAEEREMTTHRYPDLQKHEAEHEKFKKEINALNAMIRMTGAHMSHVQTALVTSVEWLVDHVKRTDRELAEFLVKQGGGWNAR